MAEELNHRRLAAILSVYWVGRSGRFRRLEGASEGDTEPLVAEHRGGIVKIRGQSGGA